MRGSKSPVCPRSLPNTHLCAPQVPSVPTPGPCTPAWLAQTPRDRRTTNICSAERLLTPVENACGNQSPRPRPRLGTEARSQAPRCGVSGAGAAGAARKARAERTRGRVWGRRGPAALAQMFLRGFSPALKSDPFLKPSAHYLLNKWTVRWWLTAEAISSQRHNHHLFFFFFFSM